MRMCHFWAQNTPICPKQNFLVQSIILSSTCWPFPLGKILKKFLQQIRSYEDAPFLGPKWSICPTQIFFLKINNITLIYLLATFIVQNVKKILPADPELWGCTIFEPKVARFPKWEFLSENLFMSLEISMIKEY